MVKMKVILLKSVTLVRSVALIQLECRAHPNLKLEDVDDDIDYY
jgi:hypothetical protein